MRELTDSIAQLEPAGNAADLMDPAYLSETIEIRLRPERWRPFSTGRAIAF